MHGQLFEMTVRDEGGEGDGTAHPPFQPGPRPDVPPGVTGDEVLEVGGEIGGAGARAVNMGIAEHRPTNRHAVIEAFLIGAFTHDASPS